MIDLLKSAHDLVPETLTFLGELAAIDTGTGQVEGIGRAGDILSRELLALNFEVRTVPAEKYGRHLVARHAGQGRPILLLGHLDTVHAPGTARRPEPAGDRLSGPGVYDCKGGLALCVAACRIWAREGWPACPVTIVINADEEIGSLSSRPLIEAAAVEARAALVVEPAPALDKVITARKGIGRYILRVFGRAAHAGADREAGVNALVDLAAKILALERLNDGQGDFSVTVGTAAGGIRPNIVPDYAQAEIDLRLTNPASVEAALAAINRAAAETRVVRARYRLEGEITRPPMPENDGGRALFALAERIGRPLGLNLNAAASGGGSDGNFCAALGVPTLDGLGPAGAGAHAEHEHILVSSLAPRLALLCELGWELGKCKT